MPSQDDKEPPRWRELCEALRRETDPEKFNALVKEIDRVLTEYEKRKRANAE